MSDMMKEAHARASRYAPPPEWSPVTGGLAGAAAFCVPMIIFATTSVGVSVYALILNAVIGFALPFFWIKSRKDAYHRAWSRELEAIRGRQERRPEAERGEISLKL